MPTRASVLVLSTLAALLAGLLGWRAADWAREPEVFRVFDELGLACTIHLPADASPEERRAAKLLQRTLAKAAGRHAGAFPIVVHTGKSARGIVLARGDGPLPGAHVIADWHEYAVTGRQVTLRSWPAVSAEAGAAWLLEKNLGARWFMPGALGEHIPRRPRLEIAPTRKQTVSHLPSFLHRNLGVGGGEEQNSWWRSNRLYSPFRHGHAMNEVFPAEVLKKHPELAPLVNGRRRFPNKPGDQGWQPNLASPQAVPQAVAALRAHFARNPHEVSAAIGLNDTINFDQSPETQARLEPKRWFRQKPDYSDLYFGFVNAVARQLPGRYFGAYAYDWTEQVPRLPVEKNVIPWLTSDKAQWFDRAFAEVDKDLIRRWLKAGPEIVGVYDYYEGAPYLVPRPTLHAVAESIPFLHQAGVRAFYAEGQPNWGLDGPKHWLAAQLLWDATQDPDKLLETYYREFWQEAAEPMRRYFELIERQWLNQPKPAYWLKYFKDEHQYLLFPPAVRRGMQAQLAEAAALARSRIVRQRVEFARQAFAVMDAFCLFNEAREELARALLENGPDAARIAELVRAEQEARGEFEAIHRTTRRQAPLAVQAEILPEYVRHDPAGSWRQRDGRAGPELLLDPKLERVAIKPPADFTSLDWTESADWRGSGEPFEMRQIEARAAGTIRFSGCKQEMLWQWRPGDPLQRYAASVRVRAKVSPGNVTFLILNFADKDARPLGYGVVDRLPVGEWSSAVGLFAAGPAPAGTAFVGMGIRVLNQVDGDYAEFSGFSLRRLD